MVKHLALMAAVGSMLAAGSTFAAPVIIQDFEAPGNLDDPFNLHPGFSGTSQGELTPTNTLVADDGAQGTTQSSQVAFTDDPAVTETSGGHAWQIRHLPNSAGGVNAANPLFAADGYVGYWLKVEPTTTVARTAPVLEGPAGTGEATVGTLQSIIADGQWHLYQWNMDDPTQFVTPWSGVYDLASTLGDTDLESTNSFDSIAFVSETGGDFSFRIDQIQYDNAGPIPEPTSLAMLSLGGLGLLARRRRHA